MSERRPANPLLRSVLLVGLVLGGLAVAPAHAQQAAPPLTGRVVDLADILSSATESTLTDLLAAHEDATGNQVAVLTTASLQGETVESYALRVAEAWGLGTAERDNGVLLVVAVEDRALRIEVGYGLEGALPDAVAGRIIRDAIVPSFREGDYERGIEAGVLAILDRLDLEVGSEDSAAATEPVLPDPPASDEAARPFFAFDLWFLPLLAFYLALLTLSGIAAGVAVLDRFPARALFFLALAPCFYVAGENVVQLLYYVVNLGGLYEMAGALAVGAYAVLFWGMAYRIDHQAASRTAWERYFARAPVNAEAAVAVKKKEAVQRDDQGVSAASPARAATVHTVAGFVFCVMAGAALYMRWLFGFWLAVAFVQLLFISSRLKAQRAGGRSVFSGSRAASSRRAGKSWFSGGSARSSRSSRSSSRSTSSRSYSSRSSSSGSSFSGSSSSFSGGGGSFGGGGASGSW